MTEDKKEIIQYAIDCFCFVLPFNGVCDFNEWAGAIEETYDKNHPKIQKITNILRSTEGRVTRQYGYNKVEIAVNN